jgi:hypothetical protein
MALNGIKSRFRGARDEPHVAPATVPSDEVHEMSTVDPPGEHDDMEKQLGTTVDQGVLTIEAVQAIWGKKGRWLIIVGLALIMIIYEIDNSTVYIYSRRLALYNLIKHGH